MESKRKKPKTHGFNCDNATLLQKRFYMVYEGIRGRCNRPSQIQYKNYGGRGIKLERKTFTEFMNDMRDSYKCHCEEFGQRNTTIERIDNDGNYCKENCTWKTHKEQRANTTSKLKTATIDGVVYTSQTLAEKLGIDIHTASSRIDGYKAGTISKEMIFSNDNLVGLCNIKYTDVEGEQYTSKRLAKEVGLKIDTARDRLKKYRLGKIDKEALFKKTELPKVGE